MNRELKAAGLLLEEASGGGDPLDVKRTGFLEPISTEAASTPEERILTASVYSNDNCGLNDTAILLDRQNHLLAAIQPNGSDEAPYRLSGIAVSSDPQGRIIVASGWFVSNCTSAWNGSAVRIDVVSGGVSRNLLDSFPGARQLQDIAVKSEGDIVTFRYIAGLADAEMMERPGIARYRVESDRAVRLPPVALSLAGFIDEWLRINDTEAVPWSGSEAAPLHHAVAADFHANVFTWKSVAECAGTPATSEVRVDLHEINKTYVFVITGAHAADLKMKRVSSAHSCAARNLPDSDGFTAIARELP